jgi:flagellar protein FliS
MNNHAHAAVSQYQTTNNSAIAFADPHVLILRMMDGAIERINQAKGAMQQKNTELKGKLIGKAINIISGLDGCLDRDLDNDLVINLGALYEYMNVRLLEANVENDSARLDEVAGLLGEIRLAWVQIPSEVKLNHAAKAGDTK